MTYHVAWQREDEPSAPLVVLLHGRGSTEREIVGLADLLTPGPSYVALRAPIAEGDGYAWFAKRGIGRPVPASLAETMAWFRGWLDDVAPPDRSVVLVGFSGGGAFAGGLLLDDPGRYDGTAVLAGTLPFEAGVPTTPGRLHGHPVLVAHSDEDVVIPRELLDRTWDYVTGESGARATALRYAGGHTLTPAVVAALDSWLVPLVPAPRA